MTVKELISHYEELRDHYIESTDSISYTIPEIAVHTDTLIEAYEEFISYLNKIDGVNDDI